MAGAATETIQLLPCLPAFQPEASPLKVNPDKIPDDLQFDPVALKQKYLEERDKRLRSNPAGVEQYIPVEGLLSHYIEDPFVGEVIERESIDEECEALIVGGGYGGQLVAVRLIEAGIKNVIGQNDLAGRTPLRATFLRHSLTKKARKGICSPFILIRLLIYLKAVSIT